MRTRIKFCGMVRGEDVDAAVALGADAIGLVLWPRSPRALDVESARALRRRLPSFVAAVGLFVNEHADAIAHAAARVGLDVLQLHGDESADDCMRAAAAAHLPWWRAIRMRGEGDLIESAATFSRAECLVLDTWSEGYGGSGRRFDWRWAQRPMPGLPEGALNAADASAVASAVAPPVVAAATPRVVLSGGLDPASVGQAVLQVAPFAVDVSSGIQGPDPRRKDAGSMERFVAAVVAADAQRAQRAART